MAKNTINYSWNRFPRKRPNYKNIISSGNYSNDPNLIISSLGDSTNHYWALFTSVYHLFSFFPLAWKISSEGFSKHCCVYSCKVQMMMSLGERKSLLFSAQIHCQNLVRLSKWWPGIISLPQISINFYKGTFKLSFSWKGGLV